MQDIIVQKPYKFVPPCQAEWLPKLVRRFELFRRHLRKNEGVIDYEIRHVDRLRESLRKKCAIVLTPNHPRTADPIIMGWLAKHADCLLFGMASWHLFNVSRMTTWAMRVMGAFSVNREGIDRQAIQFSIKALEDGERPLLVFPEGAGTRTNDYLHTLLDGVGFLARTAAKRRTKHGKGPVVVHPVAIKYRFQGDLVATTTPVLDEIEQRFHWPSTRGQDLLERIHGVGGQLFERQEVKYFGAKKSGSLTVRKRELIERILTPLEEEWIRENRAEGVVPRIKALRVQLAPDVINRRLTGDELQRRWQQLADVYLAQQISCYPPGYLSEYPSVDRLLETVERFEEDITDKARIHGDLKAIIDIGEPIAVENVRVRGDDEDPLMDEIEQRLKGMLRELSNESPLYQPSQAVASQAISV